MDYQKIAAVSIRNAIAMLEAEKLALINQGVRPGAIVEGKNGAGRLQHHWVLTAKQRQYIPQKLLPTYRSEIERGHLVNGIDRRLGLLAAAVG